MGAVRLPCHWQLSQAPVHKVFPEPKLPETIRLVSSAGVSPFQSSHANSPPRPPCSVLAHPASASHALGAAGITASSLLLLKTISLPSCTECCC